MKLHCSIAGFTGIQNVQISESHSASCTTATIVCNSTTKDIGDWISIDLGYTTNHTTVFGGYIKMIDRDIPNNTYNITCQDAMIRAVDYFVAPDNPNVPFSRTNIAAETLVGDVLALAGLTNYSHQDTSFTLAVNGTTAEVKLIGAYDYANSIADLVAWHLWASDDGTINFKNRKPYVMYGTSGQPGDIADTALAGKVISDTDGTYNILSFAYSKNEKDLRNKVVVWGAYNIYATASASSPYLPSDFYKILLFSNPIVDTQDMAQRTADYNLALFNRLGRTVTTEIIGDPYIRARKVIAVKEAYTGLDENFYIYGCQHNWSSSGYTQSLELRA